MKNNKITYYVRNIIRFILGGFFYRKKLHKLLKNITKYDKEYIDNRVNYYNKLDSHYSCDESFITIKDFRKSKKKTYFFDLYEYLRFFDITLKVKSLFGDIIEVPTKPALLKSRPINVDNENSIVLNLDKIRHFLFIDDQIKYEDKKDMVVWRGAAYRKHRIDFVKKYYDHPLCDVGQTNNPIEDVPWQTPKMSIEEQLQYKFILSIEGNDVATNLKWIMSSNSLAFMIKPKYETWFMEGRLIPNHHYVLLKDDYSDLEEKIKYYSKHIDEGKKIIQNANQYVEQFKDQEREDLISLLVLEKYFKLSMN